MGTEEPYPPDREDLLESHDYVIERNDRASIVYTRHGSVAHIWDHTLARTVKCGMDTWGTWYGTGTMREIEEAHRRPVCKRCLAAVGMTHLEREENPR